MACDTSNNHFVIAEPSILSQLESSYLAIFPTGDNICSDMQHLDVCVARQIQKACANATQEVVSRYMKGGTKCI